MTLSLTRSAIAALAPLLVGLVSLAACGAEDPSAADPITPAATESAEPDATPPPAQPAPPTLAGTQLSTCGGFDDNGSRDATDYCAAELLKWHYDAANTRLSLLDARISLNCCGVHSVQVSYDDANARIVVTETDAPEEYDGNYARCNCSCVFDFAVDIDNVRGPAASISLVRHVTDEGDPKELWAGTLDLSAGGGEIVLSEEPALCADGT